MNRNFPNLRPALLLLLALVMLVCHYYWNLIRNKYKRTGKNLNKLIGFDIDKTRIKEINSGYDRTREVSIEDIKEMIILCLPQK